jgi:hypothetical protein
LISPNSRYPINLGTIIISVKSKMRTRVKRELLSFKRYYG